MNALFFYKTFLKKVKSHLHEPAHQTKFHIYGIILFMERLNDGNVELCKLFAVKENKEIKVKKNIQKILT